MPRLKSKSSPEDRCSEPHATHRQAEVKPMELAEAQRMGEFFAVLSDPTRLRMVALLAEADTCVCDLATALSMTESAVSHQLRALRMARLVTYRKEGRQVFYRLHDAHVLDLYRTVRDHLAES
jgi:ArsR family transcriptional regulator, lead/cadmium/zinc/bismuth-responsive transcriptional repressor